MTPLLEAGIALVTNALSVVPTIVEAIRAANLSEEEKKALLAKVQGDIDRAHMRVASMEIRDV